MSSDKRPTLSDILAGGSGGFNDLWDGTEAADEFEPLPPGTYKCLVADGKLAESRATMTPSYRVVFEVIEGTHKRRRIWLDFWLTQKALPSTKRDPRRFGIQRSEQLRQPPPAGLIAEVTVVVNTENDGRNFNKVTRFKIVGKAPSPAALQPDADELADEEGEDESAEDEGSGADYPDSGGFDWQAGEQQEPRR